MIEAIPDILNISEFAYKPYLQKWFKENKIYKIEPDKVLLQIIKDKFKKEITEFSYFVLLCLMRHMKHGWFNDIEWRAIYAFYAQVLNTIGFKNFRIIYYFL